MVAWRVVHAHDLTLVRALAASQAGVISRQQLVRAGFDFELPSREAAAKRWLKLLPGVYLTNPDPPTFEQQCHASLLHAGRTAIISGAAGWALQHDGVPGAPQHVLVLVPNRTQKVSRDFCTLVRTCVLPTAATLAAGAGVLRVASPERCLADALRRARDLGDARAFACRAIRYDDLRWHEVVAEASRPGPGNGHLPRVVADLTDGVRSAPEGALHDALLPASRIGRLPPYLLNPDLYVDGVFLGSPDAYFPGLGLADEMDSREWHEGVSELDATLLRHERFQHHGLTLNHTTPQRFQRSPGAHVAKLEALVEIRRRLAVPEPAGLLVLARGPLLPHRSPWPTVADVRLGLGGSCRDVAA